MIDPQSPHAAAGPWSPLSLPHRRAEEMNFFRYGPISSKSANGSRRKRSQCNVRRLFNRSPISPSAWPARAGGRWFCAGSINRRNFLFVDPTNNQPVGYRHNGCRLGARRRYSFSPTGTGGRQIYCPADRQEGRRLRFRHSRPFPAWPANNKLASSFPTAAAARARCCCRQGACRSSPPSARPMKIRPPAAARLPAAMPHRHHRRRQKSKMVMIETGRRLTT